MLGQMAEARFTQASYRLQPQLCLLLYSYNSVHLIPTTTQHVLKHSGLCVNAPRSVCVYTGYHDIRFVSQMYENM